MLLDLAEALTPLLKARKERLAQGKAILRDGFDEEEVAETTLQIVFFDGEEAFHDWTDTDSIYGARWVLSCLSELFSFRLQSSAVLPPLRLLLLVVLSSKMSVLIADT